MFFRSYDGQQYQEGNLNVSKHKTNYIGRITGVEGGKISFDTIEKMMNTAGKKGSIIESDNKLHLVPIFTAKPAEVKFAAEEETVVGFSGSKNVKGFKVGQTLNCTQIDKVTMTASDVTEGQNVYPCDIDRESYNYELVKNKNTDKWEYVKKNSPAVFKSLQDGKTDITATVDIDYDKEIFTACYNRPTLTFEYTPSEVNSSTSKWGGIMVSPYNDTNNVVGAGDFETPVKITSQDLAVLRTTYVATAIIDDAKDAFDSIYYDNAGNEIKIPMRTKTVWTYYDKNQKRNTTAQGNSFAFRPWFNNDTVYYHFIAEQLNEELRGLSGKVYTQEVPLFSGEGAQKESTPAVGVDLLVGGYNGRTGSDGSYSISPHFNLGDNLTVFAKYDSLQYTDNAIISMGTTHDIIIDVNENDALSVTSSVMEKDQVTNEAKDPLRIGVVQKTYVRQNTTCMLLEDTNYYLSLNAKGSAGFVPKEAEFRIYSKKGEYKSDLTKRVAFTLNGNEGSLTYKLNPMSVNGNKLEIGDTFTVTLYDKEGNKYFEHHTGIVVAEPLTQMFLFNYDSWSKEDDSAFVSALGNISLGYDFALDVLTSPGVTYDDNGKPHMFCSIGFGESTNNPKALFNKATQTKNMLDEMEHGTYTPDKYTELGFGGGSSSGTPDDFKATGNSSWNLKIQIAMILDCIVEKTDPDRKGQMYFNDFLIIAGCNAKYERTWNIPVKAVTINIRLSFAVNPLADGFGSGIRWHFSNADDKVKNYITKETDESKNSDNKQGNSTINLLAWDGTKSYGDIGFNITIFADFNVDIKGIFSVGGSINVNVENHVLFKDNSLSDIGAVNLSPTVYITITFLKIPLWSTTFNWPWVNDNIKHSPPELKPPTDEEIQTDILFNKTSDREIIDFSELYANREWGGSVFRQFAPGNPESAEEVTEAVLQKGFYSESDIRVQDLGNGKYFATFIDLVPGRATPDAFGAYYSIYNGKTWSVPQLLEDDGTADDIPTICNAGSKGWLIVWSDASRKLDENENVGSMLNTYDLTGRFFNPETNKLGDVMEITKTSGSDDVCDTSPEISYYEENGQEFMKIYYTKSEYSVSSEEDGEVIGDILNPYELKAIRNYDFVNDKWAEDYSGKTKEYLMGKYGEKYSDYVKKWYGQEFLTLAPPLEVNESVDDIGYWKNGTTATVAETDLSQAMAKDSAVITYNNLSLQAYTLDKGGMAQENQDENLYLQIYNYHDDEYHHPILISGNNAEISDLQFVRMPVQTDNGTTEVTYLYWLEDYCIKRINISSLVKNSLVLGKTSTGQEYYYIDKTAGSAFEPEQVLVKPTITVNDEGEESIDEAVTSFKVRQNGDYNYLMWIEALQKVDENSKQKMEQQLFAMRENSAKSEMTLPVQITDKEDQFINRFDFAVTDNGELDVLADRIMIGEDGHVDTNTSELTSFHIKPSDKLVISEVSDASIALNDDGSLAAQVNMTLENKNFNTQQNVIVEVQDENGNVVYTTDKPFATYEVNESVLEGGNFVSGDFTKTETEFKLDMIGGQTQPASIKIPMGRDGKYAGKVVLKVDGNVVETRELSGQLKPELQADRFIAAVTDRNEIRLDATVKNINYLESEESTVKYGYLDADGNQVELGTTNIVSLDSNEETDFNVTASIDFDKFVSELAEDGSITDTLQFYLEGDNFDTVYSTVSLSATSEEYKLMTELKNTDAKLSQYNTDGDLEKLETFNVGDIGCMNLWLEDDFVQNIDQYTGRTKLVWTEKSDSVASITRNGVVTANGDGTTTLNGYIVPADTESILFEDGTSEAVDNFVSKPSEVIIPISANITVGDGSPEQTGNIATDDEIREWAIADYQGKNAKLVSVSTLKVQDDGKYEISFFDEVGNTLDKYVIDPKTGKGTNAANEAIDLPQTGMNSIAKMLIVVSALLMMWIGLTLVIYSGGFRRKRDEKETE